MPRMVTVLEDCIRYRDGKKWKRRYCLLAKPDYKKRTVTMFITKQFGANVSSQDIDEKSIRHYLVDDITGFEHGRHVDKESQVMALIGSNVVYCIAFEHTQTMFRWAETLNKLLTSVNFHVTLKKSSEISNHFARITPGTQGNLHVQLYRLCLIGEPADGNKFICEWAFSSLISLDIQDTKCDKIKKLQIKSNGKSQKGKGHFEFEINLTQKATFDDSFRTFLTSCKSVNPEFETNFLLLRTLTETSSDTVDHYSVACSDKSRENSGNGKVVEKRSSTIPIPRSREHSGTDKRPVENVQIKMRKSHKNLQRVRDDTQKHSSVILRPAKHEHNSCLFADDEEMEDQVHHKSQNLFYSRLSQDSSGVCVNSVSDSIKEPNAATRIITLADSGCGNLSSDMPPSTSCVDRDIDHDVLPLCQNPCSPKNNLFSTFYRNINRNPLSLNNYANYYRLLRTVLQKRSQLMKRSNSYNCVHVPDMKKLEFSRKYSHTNFPLSLTSKATEQHFNAWKDTITDSSIEGAFLNMQLGRDRNKGVADSSRKSLSNQLPFRSLKDFHGSMMRYVQSGNVCFSLFFYHHFLSLVKEVKNIIRDMDSKMTRRETQAEYRDLRDKACRKSKVYCQWLEKMISCSSSHDADLPATELSILDVNMLLVLEIIDSILQTRLDHNRGPGAIIPRHKSHFVSNPTIELNDDKFLLVGTLEEQHLSADFSRTSSLYLESRPMLCMSSSTPDFRHYAQQERVHKLSNTEHHLYQNLSSMDTFDTMNHTFPKQNLSLNNSESLNKKEGSFKRFRRKYSPNIFIPFMRRKTSSIHSTLSEPICRNDTKEQNLYYNMSNQRDIFNKKSLSVVLDSCPYLNVRQSHNYINMSTNSGTTVSNDSSSYMNTDLSSYDDDNFPFPDEILDPSQNYGDLSSVQSRMHYRRHDADSHAWSCLRRSSLSIMSQKSLQHFGTSRSVSFSKRGYANLGRVQSDACAMPANFRSTDYINVATSSGAGVAARPQPRSLNYVSVIEHHGREGGARKFATPLSIYTESECDLEGPERDLKRDLERDLERYQGPPPPHKRSWHTPQASPVVDYCQIDLQGTYALRDLDRVLCSKARGPPDDEAVSFLSLDQVALSSSSFSHLRDRKSAKCSKGSLRKFFSRKCDSSK